MIFIFPCHFQAFSSENDVTEWSGRKRKIWPQESCFVRNEFSLGATFPNDPEGEGILDYMTSHSRLV